MREQPSVTGLFSQVLLHRWGCQHSNALLWTSVSCILPPALEDKAQVGALLIIFLITAGWELWSKLRIEVSFFFASWPKLFANAEQN